MVASLQASYVCQEAEARTTTGVAVLASANLDQKTARLEALLYLIHSPHQILKTSTGPVCFGGIFSC